MFPILQRRLKLYWNPCSGSSRSVGGLGAGKKHLLQIWLRPFTTHTPTTHDICHTPDHTAGPYLIFATGTTGTGPVENNSTMWRNFILNAEIVHFSGVSCCGEFVYFGGETFLVEIFYIVFGENVSHHFFWWRKSYKYNVCTRTVRAAQCEWQLSWLDQSLLELSSLRLQYS